VTDILPKSLKFTVLVDDLVYAKNDALIPSHGLSIYIEIFSKGEKTRLLFDTGSSFRVLNINARILKVNYASLDYVFISIWRKCHVGGLLTGLKLGENTKVIVPPLYNKRSSEKLKERQYILGSEFKHPFLKCVGPFGYRVKEQALAVRLERGYVVFTGCLRRGIEELFLFLRNNSYSPVLAVVGGLNLSMLDVATLSYLEKAVADLDIERVYPLHSTAPRARRVILKNLFNLDIECGVGFASTIP